jgi:hypothetical protein
VTSISQEDFRSAGRVGQRRLRDNDASLQGAVASSVAPRIDPSRESRLGGQVRTPVRRPPSTVSNRQVVVRRELPPNVARFARRATETRAEDRVVGQTNPQRPPRLQDNSGRDVRGEMRDRLSGANGAVPRTDVPRAELRNDRPPRADRPTNDSVRSPVSEPRTIADRVREDRDRQVRENRQRDDWQARRDQQQQQQQQDRERSQRERDAMRSTLERRFNQPDRQQPREQPRQEQPRQERPREQPRYEQPRAERPQPSRSESRSERQSPPPQPRAQPPRMRDNDGGRRNRD